jgi:hypothetical protein
MYKIQTFRPDLAITDEEKVVKAIKNGILLLLNSWRNRLGVLLLPTAALGTSAQSRLGRFW